ncbi:MAG: carboxypeptidase regulatory-like domain-containing protein [Planctomycetota bacterium]|nr:MAG: carboxypeptidase regulatory-like domain-containing protein [Planctomycetota bacterium]
MCVACARSVPDRMPTFPVHGRVMVNGEPAQHATVFFHPTDPAIRLFPHGRTDSNGYFELSTYVLNDGAPAGDYTVTITWQDPPPAGSAPDAPEGPDKLHGLFANPRTSTIRVHVAPRDNELKPFQLTVSDGQP